MQVADVFKNQPLKCKLMPELLNLFSDVWEETGLGAINVCLEFPIYGVPHQLSDTIGQIGAKLNIQHM